MRRLVTPLMAALTLAILPMIVTAPPVQAHGGNTWYPWKWNLDEAGSNIKWGLMPDWFSNNAYEARAQDGADSWTALGGNRDLNQRNDWGSTWPVDSCSASREQNGLRKITIDGTPSTNNTLAVTALCPDAHGHIWSSNMGFDQAENWYTGSGNPGGSEHDFWTIASHEFGHFLGFAGHWNEPDPAPALCGGPEPRELMCASIPTGVVRSNPQEHDRHTFNDAY